MAELVPFSTIQDKLRERIKTVFVDLIPEAAWNDLIKKEWEEFSKPVQGDLKNSYSHERYPDKPSGLSTLIRTGISEVLKEKIDAWILRMRTAPETDEELRAMIERIGELGAKNMKLVMGEMIFDTVAQSLARLVKSCSNCSSRVLSGANCGKCGNYVSQ